MKLFYRAVLAAALIAVPAFVLADTTSYPTPSAQMRQAFQYMEQAHAKVELLHTQARLAALNSLTPAHRVLLAQIIGQLAISANPDVDAAARTIDRSLSQGEGRSILSISQSLETQSQQIMETARQQMMAANPQAPGGPPGPGGPHHMGFFEERAQSTDPGIILLKMSLHGIDPGGPERATFMVH